jgi:hypothetical protein
MEEYKDKECPVCGNEQLKIYEQVVHFRIRSARTGKILKKIDTEEIECWNYLCNCGWAGELNTK